MSDLVRNSPRISDIIKPVLSSVAAFLARLAERAPGANARALARELAATERRLLATRQILTAMLARGFDGQLLMDYRAHIAELEAKLIEAEEELVRKDLDLARRERAGDVSVAGATQATPDKVLELTCANVALEERLRMLNSTLEAEKIRSIRMARTVAELREQTGAETREEAALREQMDELTGANEHLRAQADRAEMASRRVIELHRAVGALTAKFRDYVGRFQAVETVAKEREEQICELTTTLAALNAGRAAATSEVADPETRRLREAVALSEQGREEFSARLEESCKEIAHLRAKLMDYRGRMQHVAETGSNDLADRLATELKRVMLERDELSHRIEEAGHLQEDHRRIVGALEEKLRTLAGRLKQHEERMETDGIGDMKLKLSTPVVMPFVQDQPLVVEFGRIKAERDELVHEHAEAEAKLHELAERMEQFRSEKHNRESELGELRASLVVAHDEVVAKGQVLEQLRDELGASRSRYETLRGELDRTRGLIHGTDTKKQRVIHELINKVEQEADMKLRLRLAEQEAKRSHEKVERLEKKLRLLSEVVDGKALEKHFASRKRTTA